MFMYTQGVNVAKGLGHNPCVKASFWSRKSTIGPEGEEGLFRVQQRPQLATLDKLKKHVQLVLVRERAVQFEDETAGYNNTSGD